MGIIQWHPWQAERDFRLCPFPLLQLYLGKRRTEQARSRLILSYSFNASKVHRLDSYFPLCFQHDHVGENLAGNIRKAAPAPAA